MAEVGGDDEDAVLGRFMPGRPGINLVRLRVDRRQIVLEARWRGLLWLIRRSVWRRDECEVVRVNGGGVLVLPARGNGPLQDWRRVMFEGGFRNEPLPALLRRHGWIVEESFGARPRLPRLVVVAFERDGLVVLQSTTNNKDYGPHGSTVLYEISADATAEAIAEAIVISFLGCDGTWKMDRSRARDGEDAIRHELGVVSRRMLSREVRQVRISWNGAAWAFDPCQPVGDEVVVAEEDGVTVPRLRDATVVRDALLTALDRCRLRA